MTCKFANIIITSYLMLTVEAPAVFLKVMRLLEGLCDKMPAWGVAEAGPALPILGDSISILGKIKFNPSSFYLVILVLLVVYLFSIKTIDICLKDLTVFRIKCCIYCYKVDKNDIMLHIQVFAEWKSKFSQKKKN